MVLGEQIVWFDPMPRHELFDTTVKTAWEELPPLWLVIFLFLIFFDRGRQLRAEPTLVHGG